MKIFEKMTITIIIVMLIAGCTTDQPGDTTGSKKAMTGKKDGSLPHEALNLDSFNVSKNNGSKWEVDSITHLNILKIDRKVEKYARKMRGLSAEGYNKLAADIDHNIRQIKNKGKIKNETANELKKLLNPIKKEAEVLSNGRKKEAQIALYNISELIKAYKEHFEYKKD